MRSCFIISPFGEEGSEGARRSDQIFRYVIKPVLNELEFEPIRVDEISSPGVISNQIIARIISSDLVIADLAGFNPNVLYELGIRHATGGPVIHITDSIDKFPFDISVMRCLIINHYDIDSIFTGKAFLKQEITRIMKDPAEYRSPTSTIADLAKLRDHQHLNISAYLPEFKAEQVETITKAVQDLAEALGLVIEKREPPVCRSWLQKWITKTKDAVSKPEVAERLYKLEMALSTQLVKKGQAEVDRSQAEAAQQLITSLNGVQDAVILIGSLLMIKRTKEDGATVMAIRTLTTREMITLEQNPSFMKNPAGILEALDNAIKCKQDFLPNPSGEGKEPQN